MFRILSCSSDGHSHGKTGSGVEIDDYVVVLNMLVI
jgi:hypothetical protein